MKIAAKKSYMIEGANSAGIHHIEINGKSSGDINNLAKELRDSLKVANSMGIHQGDFDFEIEIEVHGKCRGGIDSVEKELRDAINGGECVDDWKPRRITINDHSL